MANKQKLGICKNIECDNFNKKLEIGQEEEPLCPICHKPLEMSEKKPVGLSKSWIIVIVLFVILLVVGGFVGYEFFRDTKPARSRNTITAEQTKNVEKETAERSDKVESDASLFDQLMNSDDEDVTEKITERKKDTLAETAGAEKEKVVTPQAEQAATRP